MNMNMSASSGATATDQRPPIPPIVILRKSNNNNLNGLPQIVNSATCQGIGIGSASSYVKKATVIPNLQHIQYKKIHESASTESTDEDATPTAETSEDAEFKSGRIRKRRYSMARIQPTRIKKVMQSDEEIGRMVASVPVAIGSAMELFAEKLLQGAAEALQNSSTKTLSPIHIKQAIMHNPHFFFLEPILKDIQLPPGTVSNYQQQQLQNYYHQKQQSNEG